MKKAVVFLCLLCMVLSLSACGSEEITIQKIYDASLNEAMLENHESVLVRDAADGEPYSESYLTKDYFYYKYIAFDWVEFFTGDAYYDWFEGDYARIFPVTSEGVSDIASYRAEYYVSSLFTPDTVYETIESVSEKDGRITVVSFLEQEALENKVEENLTSGRYEYVLDAKSLDVISCSGDHAYDDGTVSHVDVEVSYDAEAPEMVKTFLEYANQTEDLRNVTIVINPGTEKEISRSFRVAKGLFVDCCYGNKTEATFEMYTDAACTEAYDPYENTDTESDLTIYVKWTEKAE